MLEGNISVNSEYGKGTEFKFKVKLNHQSGVS